LTTAIIFGVTGVLWHFPRVTRTDGIIVESVAVAGAQNKRLITYEYTAYGARHRGQRLLGWGEASRRSFSTWANRFQFTLIPISLISVTRHTRRKKRYSLFQQLPSQCWGLVLFCLDRASDKLRIDEFNGSGFR
jgi:hypothetical protein